MAYNISTAKPKALIFDLMGTCCDWYSSIRPAMSSTLPSLSSTELSQLAADWRAGFFSEIHDRFQTKKPAEDIDLTHRRVLDRLLDERYVDLSMCGTDAREILVARWHNQIGKWPDYFHDSSCLYCSWGL
jgi:FMN phosphatase YigB (HAD superfamily)